MHAQVSALTNKSNTRIKRDKEVKHQATGQLWLFPFTYSRRKACSYEPPVRSRGQAAAVAAAAAAWDICVAGFSSSANSYLVYGKRPFFPKKNCPWAGINRIFTQKKKSKPKLQYTKAIYETLKNHKDRPHLNHTNQTHAIQTMSDKTDAVETGTADRKSVV